MRVFVYLKATTPSGYTTEEILPLYYKVPEKTVKLAGGKKKFLEAFKASKPKAELEKVAQDHSILGRNNKIEKLELVTQSKDTWIHGEYYAHEYDAHVEGRGRKVRYSNGYKEYEIECLDHTKAVADGVWFEEDIGVSQIGNGSGDYFEPHERGLL